LTKKAVFICQQDTIKECFSFALLNKLKSAEPKLLNIYNTSLELDKWRSWQISDELTEQRLSDS